MRTETRQAGLWTVGDRLGEGHMGVVYRCTRDGDPRAFAMKILHRADPVSLARFEQERLALAALSHPNIARVHDSGASPDGPWLVMDFVPGVTLLGYRDRPPLSPASVLGIAAQLASALAHAHARGVYHRDLKLNNVMLDPTGRVTLVDFGVALITDHPRLTVGRGRPGTPAYAPPEWFTDGPDRPAEADCYALGVIVHELLVGAPAFPKIALADLGRAKAQIACLDPGLTLADAASSEASAIVSALTARDPASRPSAAEIAGQLASWPALPPPPSGTLGAPGELSASTLGDAARPRRIGRYVPRDVLGRGGAGVVYRAFDPLLARDVAVKRLTGTDPASLTRFQREAQAIAALDHPGVVRMLDFGADADGPYYAMEWVDGPTLSRVLLDGRPGEARAVAWAIALGRALAAAHGRGVVHRDVKPSNVLMEGGTQPKLVDFGLATAHGADKLTVTDQVLGTPAYMAPEQALSGPIDARTDVYGLGAVLYEMLSGHPPFGADQPVAVLLQRLVNEEPARLVTTPALARVVHQAIARSPSDRYATMEAFVADLVRIRDGEAVVARSLGWASVRRFVSGPGRTWAIAGLAIGGLGIGGVGADRAATAWTARRREAQADDRLAALLQRLEASLDPSEAKGAFAAFAALPEHRGTSAVSRGWLAWSEHQGARGDRESALTARAEAWTTATSGPDEQAALLSLGRQFAAENQWDALGAALRALDDAGLGGAEDLRHHWKVANRQSTPLNPKDDPLASRLRHATKVPWSASRALPIDFLGDPRPELILADDDQAVQWIPGGAWLGAQPKPILPDDIRGPAAATVVPRWGPVLVARDARAHDGSVLVRLGPQPKIVAHFRARTLYTAVGGDLDADGRGELYVGTGLWERDLLALTTADGETWTVRDASPSVSASNSEVTGVRIGDLDGDGAPSLYVAQGAFGGYDVRILDRALALVKRRKIGEIWGFGPLARPGYPERMAALVHGGGPPYFPVGRPSPAIVALDADLTTSATLPDRCQGTSILFGDFDGDRATDIVGHCPGDGGGTASLVRQAGDGSLAEERIRGVRAMAAGDADGDGDDELFAWLDDAPGVWALGTGTTPLPPAAPLPPLPAPPDDADAAIAAAWRRAESLVAMWLTAQAIEQLVGLGSLDAGPTGARALVRAADLEGARSQPGRAAALYGRAAARPEVAAIACAGAADAWALVHDYPSAASFTERWLALPDASPAERERRQADLVRFRALGSAPSQVLDLTAGLGPEWEIERPFEVQATGRGLRLDAVRNDVLARIPVTLSSGRLGMVLDLTVVHPEAAAGLAIEFVPRGAPPDEALGLRVTGQGGSGNAFVYVGFSAQGLAGRIAADTAAEAEGQRVTIRWDLESGRGFFGSVTRGDASQTVAAAIPGAGDGPAGAWDLVFSGRHHPGDQPAVMSVLVHQITLIGATPHAAPRDAPARARVALSVGRPADVLAEKLPENLASDLMRAAALDDLSRWDESRAALRGAVQRARPDELEAQLPPLIRGRSPRFIESLRAVLGDRWTHLFVLSWDSTLHYHPQDPSAITALTEHLGPVTPGASPEALEEAAELERLRARSWRSAGRADLACDAARRAVAIADRITTPGRDVPAPPKAASLRELAACLVTSDPSAAFDALTRAVASSPSPEVFADALAMDATFEPLRADPRWAPLDAARRSAFAVER